MYDCVIIGGGPGGLAAALYLARFRKSCVVLDAGGGRASLIPCCRNFPGYPDGIAGKDLLTQMRDQLARYGEPPIHAEAVALQRTSEGIRVQTAAGDFVGRTAVLATGMLDVKAPFENENDHDEALKMGLLHYCPICDGYEVTDKPVVVLGSRHHGVKEALFLHGFSDTIELVCPTGAHMLSDSDRSRLQALHITVVDGPISRLRLEENALHYAIADRDFTTPALYVAMGCRQRSSLAALLGAKVSDDGCVVVDDHQRTSVEGLYAAGDVVAGLDQIVTAIGQAAVAATAIRNDLQTAYNDKL